MESSTPAFLNGGGEMRGLIRAYDWHASSLGDPQSWPQSLKTSLSLILNAHVPMLLLWGADSICFYNDAYHTAVIGKQPNTLGRPGKEVWVESWDVLGTDVATVMRSGESIAHNDQKISFLNYGRMAFACWKYSCSAIMGEAEKVTGVLVTCIENASKRHEADLIADNVGIFLGLGDEAGNAVYFSRAWSEFTGRSMDDLLGFGWLDLVHPEDQHGYASIYTNAFKVQRPFEGEFRLRGKDGSYRWFHANAVPRFLSNGDFAGYVSATVDVTGTKEVA